MAFSPDRTMFAVGTSEDLVRLYDMSTGEIIATFLGHNSYVSSVSFTPDGKALASGSYDGTILRWDLTTYRVTQTVPLVPISMAMAPSVSQTSFSLLRSSGLAAATCDLTHVSIWTATARWGSRTF